jgi:AraC-like DNA-binding protein
MLLKINKWFQNAKKNFFKYKDGFFELPYFSNTPQAIIASFSKMPFVKHNKVEQSLSTNNPFSKSTVHYHELEEGLWLFYIQSEYKANVLFKQYFDKDLPSNYYLLIYNIDSNDVEQKTTESSHHISIENKSWVLSKPGAIFNIARFKHSKTNTLSVYFTKEWLVKNIWNTPNFQENKLPNFFECNAKYITWPDKALQPLGALTTYYKLIMDKGSKGMPSIAKSKKLVFHLFEIFIQTHKAESTSKTHFEIPNTDRVRVMKLEHHLVNNLLQKFEGINQLANRFNISPTKVKSDFKIIYGRPIFQYYQEKQMQLAAEILKKEDIRIKELANRMGYESVGKFSQAFKKYFNVLPSAFSQKE